MEINKVKKYIQSFFDQHTVTIVGSGLSAAEGIPGMWGIAKKLIEDMPKKISEESLEQWESIEKDLKNGIDLESALQKNYVNEDIEKNIISITYELISNKDMKIFTELLERRRRLVFSEYLLKFNISLYNLVVITTNYDLLIEYACENINHPYIDSFTGKIVAIYSPEEAKKEMIKGVDRGRIPRNNYHSHIKLYKPHGSINWKSIDGEFYRVQNIDLGVPCIITPGTNKYEKGYDIPFDYHIGRMGEEIDKAEKIIFIGYGFNDNHLETHLNKLNNINKPKLIITKSLTDNAKKVISDNVIAIELYEEDSIKGSKVYWGDKRKVIEGMNLWSLGDLLKEVF